VVWFATRRPAPAPPREAPAVHQVDTSAALARAQVALQAHDYDAAALEASQVLKDAPADVIARGILDRARAAAAAVESGLNNARTSLSAGDYQAASRAAGDVLTLAPGNKEAHDIMEQGAARAGARSAADAKIRMVGARDQARSANAQRLAATAYRKAVGVDQAAERLLRDGRPADATARFYEASGLYQSAAAVAQAQAEERARPPLPPASAPTSGAASPESSRPVAPAPPPPGNSRPTLPEPQASLPVTTSLPPTTAPAPAPPPAAPPTPAPAVEEPSARGAAADEAIGQLLGHYRSALENKDLDALRKIWPGLPEAAAKAIRADFQNASRIAVDILDPRISTSGATGTVMFRRRYELQTHDGQRLRTETQTTMTVRRASGGWVIDAVRFTSIR
jgi:hypothetical protein